MTVVTPTHVHAPTHLHALEPVARPAGEVREVLRTDGTTLVAGATSLALAAVTPLLLQGRFRRPAAPRSEIELPADGPAVVRVAWNRDPADHWPPATGFATRPTSRWWRSDEEETGWPSGTFDLVVEPREHGCRLAVLSSRPPGTDTSTNRIDRHLRDRIARDAVQEFVAALAALVEATSTR
jgi:hypothetical protein